MNFQSFVRAFDNFLWALVGRECNKARTNAFCFCFCFTITIITCSIMQKPSVAQKHLPHTTINSFGHSKVTFVSDHVN